MTRTGTSALVLILGCGLTAVAAAAEYDYQVGLGYDRGQVDSTVVSTLNGVPDPSLGTARTSADADHIHLTGAWFYTGLSDANGPKSRAAFMSRASSLAVSYSRGDESSSFEFSGGSILPPLTGRADTTSDEVSLDLRHVWQGSGWYALAGIARAELEGEGMTSNGNASSFERDANSYRLGVGKYIGKATTLELGVTTLDAGSSHPTVAALSLSHIGSLGASWQYGADVTYAKSDTRGEGDVYAVRGALFPTASIEFGLAFSRIERIGGVEFDSLGVFAGWFVRDNIELAVRYQLDDPDESPGQDIDSDEFGIGVSMRF